MGPGPVTAVVLATLLGAGVGGGGRGMIFGHGGEGAFYGAPDRLLHPKARSLTQ